MEVGTNPSQVGVSHLCSVGGAVTLHPLLFRFGKSFKDTRKKYSPKHLLFDVNEGMKRHFPWGVLHTLYQILPLYVRLSVTKIL